MNETKPETFATCWDWELLLSRHQTIVVATDLEPDDLVALVMLRNMTRNHKDLKMIFLVGEGNSAIKEARMLEYVNLLKFCDDRDVNNIKVIKGYPSDVDFSLDGEDVLTREKIAKCRKLESESNNKYGVPLEVLLETANDQVLYLSLKPPRELYTLWKVYGKTFANFTMVGYMSFNLRELFTAPENLGDNISMVENFLKSFSKILYYETFFASNELSIDIGMIATSRSEELIFAHLPLFITQLIKDWNDSTLNRYEFKRSNGEMLSEKQTRIKKKIEENKGMQFVNADSGLLAFLLFDNKEKFIVPSQISFDKNHFSLCKIDHASSIHVIKPAENDKKEFFEKQLTIYQKLLK